MAYCVRNIGDNAMTRQQMETALADMERDDPQGAILSLKAEIRRLRSDIDTLRKDRDDRKAYNDILLRECDRLLEQREYDRECYKSMLARIR